MLIICPVCYQAFCMHHRLFHSKITILWMKKLKIVDNPKYCHETDISSLSYIILLPYSRHAVINHAGHLLGQLDFGAAVIGSSLCVANTLLPVRVGEKFEDLSVSRCNPEYRRINILDG